MHTLQRDRRQFRISDSICHWKSDDKQQQKKACTMYVNTNLIGWHSQPPRMYDVLIRILFIISIDTFYIYIYRISFGIDNFQKDFHPSTPFTINRYLESKNFMMKFVYTFFFLLVSLRSECRTRHAGTLFNFNLLWCGSVDQIVRHNFAGFANANVDFCKAAITAFGQIAFFFSNKTWKSGIWLAANSQPAIT